jgi:hypothetical protein
MFRYLDLPLELQQKIYQECDVYSRIRLDHVLKKKFAHHINNTLVLIAHALKKDAMCVNNNLFFNKFLTRNINDGSVQRIVEEFNIKVDKLNDFETFCICLENKNIDTLTQVLPLIDTFTEEQLDRIKMILYRTSSEIFEYIWTIENGRQLLIKTVFKDIYELRMFCFNLINFANLDLAKHIFSTNAQNRYTIDVLLMKEYVHSSWKSFVDRVSCLKVFREVCDIPVELLQKMLKVSMETLAVDAYKFLKQL